MRRPRPSTERHPTGSRRFTGTDLVELLRSLPHPGEEYLEAVEAGVASQPPAEDRRWPR